MDKTFIIAIPSTGRHKNILQRKSVLEYIPKSLQKYTIVFVRREEYEPYKKAVKAIGSDVIVQYISKASIDDMEYGIAQTRQHILHQCIKLSTEVLIQMDDDLKLTTRTHDETGKVMYTPMTHDSFYDMIETLVRHTGNIDTNDGKVIRAQTGITARQFSQDKPTISYDTRLIQLQALHIPTLIKEKVSYKNAYSKGLLYMTDYYICLALLVRGYHNLCLNNYCMDERPQAFGGCSIRRTVEKLNESAKLLSKMFPAVVTPFAKTSSAWKEPRINVRIQWKKAYGLSLKLRGGYADV